LPITDLDQDELTPDPVAQLEPTNQSSFSPQDSLKTSAGETTSKSDFRLVPVRSAHSKSSADSSAGFKMVPVSDVPGNGLGSGTGWQRFTRGTLFDQIKGLLALVGLFYLATILVTRRE
jgi:hypothetical protein